MDDETPKDDDVVSGLPEDVGQEPDPLGASETEPDEEAPPEDELPGIADGPEEPYSAG